MATKLVDYFNNLTIKDNNLYPYIIKNNKLYDNLLLLHTKLFKKKDTLSNSVFKNLDILKFKLLIEIIDKNKNLTHQTNEQSKQDLESCKISQEISTIKALRVDKYLINLDIIFEITMENITLLQFDTVDIDFILTQFKTEKYDFYKLKILLDLLTEYIYKQSNGNIEENIQKNKDYIILLKLIFPNFTLDYEIFKEKNNTKFTNIKTAIKIADTEINKLNEILDRKNTIMYQNVTEGCYKNLREKKYKLLKIKKKEEEKLKIMQTILFIYDYFIQLNQTNTKYYKVKEKVSELLADEEAKTQAKEKAKTKARAKAKAKKEKQKINKQIIKQAEMAEQVLKEKAEQILREKAEEIMREKADEIMREKAEEILREKAEQVLKEQAEKMLKQQQETLIAKRKQPIQERLNELKTYIQEHAGKEYIERINLDRDEYKLKKIIEENKIGTHLFRFLKAKNPNYSFKIIGGYAINFISKNKDYKTEDVDIIVCSNGHAKDIWEMRQSLAKQIQEYKTTNILNDYYIRGDDMFNVTETIENKSIYPLKLIKKYDGVKPKSIVDLILQVDCDTEEFHETKYNIDTMIDNKLSITENFKKRLEEGEKNLYNDKLISWYLQLDILYKEWLKS